MEHKPLHRVVASLLTAALILPSLPSLRAEASVTIGDPILYWNAVALDLIAHDANETYGEAQLNNPGASSRGLGMTHAAMYDALNSVTRTHDPYLTLVPVQTGTGAIDSAVAYAAYGVLSDLYSNQQSVLDAALSTHMADVHDSDEKELGKIVGSIVASELLASRTGDGSEIDGPHTAGDQPGQHRVDPLNPDQSYWGPTWGDITPFVLSSGSQFRAPEPPAITSQQYADAYNEVKTLGGDGVITPTTRTEDQTEAGIFWAYDGSKMLGTPPRFYNQIARTIIADQGGNSVEENARLLALVNLAVADAGISAWDSKFHYDYWRPVIGIREADPGTGPSGLGDGNPDTEGDPTWTPLNSPASNQSGKDFTPPFPTYPSGHATFGAAAFRMIGNYYGTDDIAFTMTSDELNGVTTDTDGNVRPLSPRTFNSLSEAAEENGMSRVYLGIHWNFDSSSGIEMGNSIADYAFANFLQPANLPADPCAQEECITIESYDLSPSVAAPAAVERDSSFQASFSVQNSGPGAATGATLSVALPSQLEINTLAAGCSVQSGSLLCSDIEVAANGTEAFSVEFTIPPQATCPDTVTFTPSVTDVHGGDYNATNNTGKAVSLQIECEPENDLSVSLDTPREQSRDFDVSAEIRVTNNGPSTASRPTVSINLPSGITFKPTTSSSGCTQNGATISCVLNSLAEAEGAAVTVAFTPLSSISCGTEITFQATASSAEKELNAGDNTSSELRTEITCSGSDPANENRTDTETSERSRDTVGNSQSPGATRGKGTTEAQFVLHLLTKRNGMNTDISKGGHYRLSHNAQTLTRPMFVASDRVVISDGFTQTERNVICGMKRYMEDQDPRNRKTDAFKHWVVGKIADSLHRDREEIQSALADELFCAAA